MLGPFVCQWLARMLTVETGCGESPARVYLAIEPLALSMRIHLNEHDAAGVFSFSTCQLGAINRLTFNISRVS